MTIIYPSTKTHRPIDFTSPVEVYRNLNKNKLIPEELRLESDISGCPIYSILQWGLIVGYSSDLVLENVRVDIQEAGQRRTKEEDRKNVHAFFVGKLVARVSDALKIRTVSPLTRIDRNRGISVSLIE